MLSLLLALVDLQSDTVLVSYSNMALVSLQRSCNVSKLVAICPSITALIFDNSSETTVPIFANLFCAYFLYSATSALSFCDLIEYIAHSLGDLAIGLGRTPLILFQCMEAVVYGIKSR